jgi:hypothetical protein
MTLVESQLPYSIPDPARSNKDRLAGKHCATIQFSKCVVRSNSVCELGRSSRVEQKSGTHDPPAAERPNRKARGVSPGKVEADQIESRKGRHHSY